MDRKSLLEIAKNGDLDKLLRKEDAQQMAIETGSSILCNIGWEPEKTGKEPSFIITKENFGKVSRATVCRPKSFPVGIPIDYKVRWN